MNTSKFSLASCLQPTVLRVALAAALIPLTATLPAHAGNFPADGQPLQTVVHYADLNLDSDAGTLVLYQRIRTAAKKVCRDVNDPNHRLRNISRACEADTIARTVLQIDSPKLTAMQAKRNGNTRTAKARTARGRSQLPSLLRRRTATVGYPESARSLGG